MDYTKKTPEQLIIIIGERDTKIEALLAQLKDQNTVVVELKDLVESHKKQVADKDALLDQIGKERTADADALKQLADAVKANNEEIVNLQKQVTDAGEIITDLKGQLNQANQAIESATDEVIVKHGNKNYRAKLKHFSHEGISYKASDLKSKPDLVKVLIEEQLGVLEAVQAPVQAKA